MLKNVVSQETDVREVLAKVALGEADAGFVYSTDAKTVPGKVKVIKVPAWAQPKVQYGICVVTRERATRPTRRRSSTAVLRKAGQAKLLAAGFLPRVKPSQEEVARCDGRRSRSRASLAARRRARVPAAADRRDLRAHLARASSSTSCRTRSSRTRSSSA